MSPNPYGYIGLRAVEITLQVCATQNRMPIDSCDRLVAALSTPAPPPRQQHTIGVWYRRREDRWLLTITGDDLRALQDQSPRA